MSKIGTTVLLKNRSVKLEIYYKDENKKTISVPNMLTFEIEDESKDDLEFKMNIISIDPKTNEPLKGLKIIPKQRKDFISGDQWYELADIITREPNLLLNIKKPYPEGDFVYHTSPTSEIEGTFKEGIADGFWICNALYGLECTGYYSNGKKNGSWVFYDCDTPIATGSYLDDKKVGIWFHFSTETKIIFE